MATTGHKLIEQDGMLEVVLPEHLTEEQWKRFSRGMNYRGFHFPTPDHARSALERLVGKSGRIQPAFKDWVDAMVYALKLEIQPSLDWWCGQSKAERALDEAVKRWGTTGDPDKGGFILLDGTFIDMSLGGTKRRLDHKHVGMFFVPLFEDSSDAIVAWKDLGLIRWVSDARGISMRVRPTPDQFKTLRTLASYRPEKVFHLDVYHPIYKSAGRTYPDHVPAIKMVSDIELYYEAGVMGAMSLAMQFHCSTD